MPIINPCGNSLGEFGQTGNGKYVGQDDATLNNPVLYNPKIINSLGNPVSFSTVAITGSYNDLSNKPTIPGGQVQSDWNQSNSSSVDFIKNKPNIPVINISYFTPNFTSATTATRLSITQDAQVVYTFPISLTTLLVSQSLSAVLKYADDVSMTTNVVTVCDDLSGASGILNLALAGKLQVHGRIPAGKYRRVTFSATGGATLPTTMTSGQEVLI